jgi:hypothetical protein
MVEILCPHCEEEIGLDDDAVGEFICPHCDGDFEWGEPEEADLESQGFDRDYSGLLDLIYSFGMLAFTLVMAIVIVVGLSSNSWYNIDTAYVDGPAEYKGEFVFGLSEVEITYTLISPAGTSIDGETYNYEDEENKILQELEEIDEYGLCDDVAEEEQQQCQNNLAEWKRETTVNLEEWEDWNSSGSLMNFFLVICLIFSIIILLSKISILLDDNTNMELPANMIAILNKADNISTFVTGILLLIGCVIFTVMSPGEFYMARVFAGDGDLSSGMGMIWWTTLLLSIGYFSASIRGLVSDFN